MKYISLHEFKDWLSEQEDVSQFFDIARPEDKYIGKEVRNNPNVSTKKMMERIETEKENANSLIEEFIDEGGTVVNVEGKNVMIEVSSGVFQLPRFCVRIRK